MRNLSVTAAVSLGLTLLGFKSKTPIIRTPSSGVWPCGVTAKEDRTGTENSSRLRIQHLYEAGDAIINLCQLSHQSLQHFAAAVREKTESEVWNFQIANNNLTLFSPTFRPLQSSQSLPPGPVAKMPYRLRHVHAVPSLQTLLPLNPKTH